MRSGNQVSPSGCFGDLKNSSSLAGEIVYKITPPLGRLLKNPERENLFVCRGRIYAAPTGGSSIDAGRSPLPARQSNHPVSGGEVLLLSSVATASQGIIEKASERTKTTPLKGKPHKGNPPLSGGQEKAKPPLPSGGASPFYTPPTRQGTLHFYTPLKGGLFHRAFPSGCPTPQRGGNLNFVGAGLSQFPRRDQ